MRQRQPRIGPLRLVVARKRGAPRDAWIVAGRLMVGKRAYVDRLECGHVVVTYSRPAIQRRCRECAQGGGPQLGGDLEPGRKRAHAQ